jgi:hypothetical protein
MNDLQFLLDKANGKPKKKAVQHEAQQQRACVRWFHLAYPEFSKLFWATPNGGKRNAREAALMKQEGVLSGVPDLFLAVPRNGYHGYFLEGKTDDGKLTSNQKEVIEALKKQGFKVDVFRSFDEFTTLIKQYLGK